MEKILKSIQLFSDFPRLIKVLTSPMQKARGELKQQFALSAIENKKLDKQYTEFLHDRNSRVSSVHFTTSQQ